MKTRKYICFERQDPREKKFCASPNLLESSPKYFAPTCNELVQHAVVIFAHGRYLVLKMIQEKEVVMLAQRIEESSVFFVRGNIYSAAIWYVESGVVFIYIFRRQAHKFVLKVTPSYMHAMIQAVGIPEFDGFFANLLDDSSCCAVDLVDISKMIANETAQNNEVKQ